MVVNTRSGYGETRGNTERGNMGKKKFHASVKKFHASVSTLSTVFSRIRIHSDVVTWITHHTCCLANAEKKPHIMSCHIKHPCHTCHSKKSGTMIKCDRIV